MNADTSTPMSAANSAVDTLRDTASNLTQSVTDTISNPTQAVQSLGNTLSNTKSYMSDTLSSFSAPASAGLGAASAAFLDSNSLVAKFAFLLLVVLVFMSLFYVMIRVIAYFSKPWSSVWIVNGLAPGGSYIRVSQNPQTSTAIAYRSNNANTGMEFTWTTWLNISNVPTTTGTYQHIFSKGSNNCEDGKVAKVNNAPGLYLSSPDGKNANLNVFMDTVNLAASANPSTPTLTVSNVPLRKWFHVAVRMQNNIMDVYVNGTISGRYQFTNVPKQNYDDIFVCGVDKNRGFSGNLSNLMYHNRALGVFELNNIIMAGPSLTQSSATTSSASLGYYTYLSNMWYNGNQLSSV
jgi:hypothetical protein